MIRTIVIDDESHNRSFLRQMLERYCSADIVIVDEADGVINGLASIAGNRPDLVISDYHMPDGNALDIVKRTEYDFILIVITAASERSIKEIIPRAIKCLFKPVSPGDLIKAIEKVKKHLNIKS